MPAKKPHERIMEFVEAELKKDPGLGSRELFERAKKISRSISSLSVRQFHARYPLVVKRRMAAGKPKSDRSTKARQSKPAGKAKGARRRKATARGSAPARRATSTRGPNRDAIREVLLDFARNLSTAESQTETIKVMSGLEKCIDRIIAAG
jgi:hypothetical protein